MSHLLKQLAHAEWIGVVGSPSSSIDLTLDVIGAAVQRKLVGELAIMQFKQDGAEHFALGQITEIELRNVWHEDPTMRSLIRQRGSVNAVSEKQDTHIGKLVLSAVFKETQKAAYDQSILGTVPATGTRIQLVTDGVLDELLKPCKQSLFYHGHVYGSTPKLPLWFKHFGSGPNGNGDAYHLGVFGKTGSGKSVLARMCLAGYSKSKEMAIIVIDPQGEFAKELRKSSPSDPKNPAPLRRIFDHHGKKCAVLSLSNLVLDRWALLEELLMQSEMFDRLSMGRSAVDNRQKAANLLIEELKKEKVRLYQISERSSFDIAWRIFLDDKKLKVIYPSEEARTRLKGMAQEADQGEFYNQFWTPIAGMFSPGARIKAKTIDESLKWVLTEDQANRSVLVIDLSDDKVAGLAITDKIRDLLIKRLLEGIKEKAEEYYKDDKSLNTLVMIDEAHRLAPRDLPLGSEDASSIRRILIDAVRTTRKYGLGWMFISQTLSSLHTEIVQQLRILFVGFGLGLGQEFQSLQQLVGSKSTALDLYQSFRDPNSAFSNDSRQYPFMTIGPISPLSFAGTPLFLSAFNTAQEFLSANDIPLE